MKLYNFKYFNIIRKFILLLILLFAFIVISAFSYTNAVFEDISKTIFRLHVIANSDSSEDQNLKYVVRDNVLQYIYSISQNAKSKEELISIVSNNINEIKNVAKCTILENGYDYDVKVNLGNFQFPTKAYGDITLPPRFL